MILGIYNSKGGVSKSTISTNLAYGFSLKGKKVLLVDLDQQGNATGSFSENYPEYELVDFLKREKTFEEVKVNIKENLDLLPTLPNGRLKDFSEADLSKYPLIIKKSLRGVYEQYDYIIIDFSPSFSQLERAGLLACDEVIPPLEAEQFSLDGLALFSLNLENLNYNFDTDIKHKRIIFSKVNKSFGTHNRIMKEIMEKNPTFQYYVFPQDANVKKTQEVFRSLYELEDGSKGIDCLEEIIGDINNG